MEVISLQSGSNGNSVYVEADGVRLLFDFKYEPPATSRDKDDYAP